MSMFATWPSRIEARTVWLGGKSDDASISVLLNTWKSEDKRNRVRKAEERNFRAVVLEEVEDEAKDGDEEEEEDGGITIEALDELSDAEN